MSEKDGLMNHFFTILILSYNMTKNGTVILIRPDIKRLMKQKFNETKILFGSLQTYKLKTNGHSQRTLQ